MSLTLTKLSGPLETDYWSYSSPLNGLVNSATYQLVVAGQSNKKAYLVNLHIITEALGAATELIVVDSTNSLNTLFRIKIGTAGLVNGMFVTFATPIYASVGGGIQFRTTTASITGAVYVNCAGYIV